MNRTILLVAAMLVAMPAALAHSPPGPVTTCVQSSAYHDYLPPNTGSLVSAGDGNIADCGPNTLEVGLGLCIPPADTVPVVCDPVPTVNQPVADYDGDIEYAHGGAFLFVRTGDGSTEGVTACFGAPSVGHHGTTIYAADLLGFGPQFTVTSDYSRAGLEENPDCGDNYVEPCIPNPPAPSTSPFPVNVVVDTINSLLYTVFGPSGDGCNPLDSAQTFPSTATAPSGGSVGFGAGADGALVVFIENDFDNARLPTAGHVY